MSVNLNAVMSQGRDDVAPVCFCVIYSNGAPPSRPWPRSWLRHVTRPRTPRTTSSTARTCGPAETNTRPCDRSGRATPSRGSTSSKPYRKPPSLCGAPLSDWSLRLAGLQTQAHTHAKTRWPTRCWLNPEHRRSRAELFEFTGFRALKKQNNNNNVVPKLSVLFLFSLF